MKQCGLPFITDTRDLAGKHVLVRASLNVPVENGVVQNYFRLVRALPTLTYLVQHGARVIIAAHIGRDKDETLEPLYQALKEHLPLTFATSVTGKKVEKQIRDLANGEALLLENLRSHKGETANEASFAKKLSSYADIYINDAFPVSHREHASIVGIPKHLPSYFGLTFREEYCQLVKAIDPASPSLFILGGAKFETKQPLIEKYRKKYDKIFVGGALANDFFAAKGLEVGDSLVSEADLSESELINNPDILLPIDVVAKGKTSVRVTTPDAVKKGEKIYDVGPKTIEMLREYTESASTILWNGPLGNYEEGFEEYTKKCAEIVAESAGYSVVGGGDTIAAIESLGVNDQFGFLSTAGGAMLHFLEKSTLPGITAVLESPQTS